MKVRDLIEELSKYDPETFVKLSVKGKSGFLKKVHITFWDKWTGGRESGVAPCLSDDFTSPKLEACKTKLKKLQDLINGEGVFDA